MAGSVISAKSRHQRRLSTLSSPFINTMEEKILFDLFHTTRCVNAKLHAFIATGDNGREGLTVELEKPLRRVMQSLLVLVSLDRPAATAAGGGVQDSSSTPRPETSQRDMKAVVEHVCQLITTVTHASVKRGSPPPTAWPSPRPQDGCDGAQPEPVTTALSREPSETRHHSVENGAQQTEPHPSLFTADTEVVGCEDAMMALQQTLVLPRRFPHLFGASRVAWRRVLLYGPPGTGKTHLVYATARRLGMTLINLSAADLLSKWVGESEKQVRYVFQLASQYEQCIVFLDEIDALCGVRGSSSETEASRRLKTELLFQLQDLAPSVTLVAATNLPWELDAAVRRRFDRFVYVGMPSAASRRLLIASRLSSVPSSVCADQMDSLVEASAAHSTSDLIHAMEHAVMAPLQCLLFNTAFRLASREEVSEAQRRRVGVADDLLASAPESDVTASCPASASLESRGFAVTPPGTLPTPTLDFPLFVACASEDPNVVPNLSADCIGQGQLLVPPVTYAHISEALHAYPPSMSEAELNRIQQWGREQPGAASPSQ